MSDNRTNPKRFPCQAKNHSFRVSEQILSAHSSIVKIAPHFLLRGYRSRSGWYRYSREASAFSHKRPLLMGFSGSPSDEFIVMVMDQAAWHKPKDLVIPETIRLIWRPPYSPQCNPAENIWDEIKEKWFPNLVFKGMQAVEDTLVEALVTLETDHERTQSTAGFDWIVTIRLNAN